jgi:Zn-dependent M28 family amino/carboxypeptidase
VAGLLEGSDPALKAETVMITAHHDHDGSSPCSTLSGGIDEHGRPIPAGPGCLQIWHGADDNGSGTVGVVELAKAFAANGVRPRRSILFVVFASEERGLLGAYYMAQHPLRPLATTRAQINFDMIGRDEKPSPQTDGLIAIPADTSNRLNLVGALYSPEYAAVVKQENAHVGLVLDDRFDHENALNVFFRSDQFPFVLHDVPAFWWFTGFHPDYHHITDTVEKIDYAKMKKILDLAYLSAWRFANDSKTPAFVADPMPAGAHR